MRYLSVDEWHKMQLQLYVSQNKCGMTKGKPFLLHNTTADRHAAVLVPLFMTHYTAAGFPADIESGRCQLLMQDPGAVSRADDDLF